VAWDKNFQRQVGLLIFSLHQSLQYLAGVLHRVLPNMTFPEYDFPGPEHLTCPHANIGMAPRTKKTIGPGTEHHFTSRDTRNEVSRLPMAAKVQTSFPEDKWQLSSKSGR
jgi:hypothetical protein